MRNTISHSLLVLFVTVASAANWPQYRSDARRSGYTPEQLPDQLALQWTYHPRHAPHRAWVGRTLSPSRMHFDWVYSVVVADGMAFFGSSADHKVYALDVPTGKVKWTRFTGGPIRLAPAVWRGKLFVGSDDGYLHCFATRDGSELWRRRLGPSNAKVLGNGRLVSQWVVRGGPAVRDGVVFVGAGIWPMEGVYIYALDANTGKVLWCNDHSGGLEIDQPHMVCFSPGGVSAQGYLAVTAKQVFVPTGRSVPAAFDRATGRFQYFHLSRYGGKTPWGTGGGDVVAAEEVFFNSGMAFDCTTGLRYHSVGQRKWWIPLKRDGRTPHGEFLNGDRQVICVTPNGFVRSEGPRLYSAVLTNRTYNAKREEDTARSTPRLSRVKELGKHHLERIDEAPTLEDAWESALPEQPLCLIVAGNTAFSGGRSGITATDLQSHRTVWSFTSDAPVRDLAVADGRLFACSEKGTILCFAPTAPRRLPQQQQPTDLAPSSPLFAQAADEILRRTGIRKGYCLDLDCRTGELAQELCRRSQLYVIGLARNDAEADQARRNLDAAGLYGVRTCVVTADIGDLPEFFANLIVSSASVTGSDARLPDGDMLQRVQRPFGGRTCFGAPGKMRVTVRGPLPGAGQWTHNLADAGNTMNSGDQLVRGPLGMLWYTDETQVTIDRHGKNPSPLAYRGLLLREGVDDIRCTDAYNGTLLWTIHLPGVLAAYREGTQVGGGQIGSTYCIEDGVLYVRKDDRCLKYDVLTGKPIGELKAPPFPGGRRGRWGYLACRDGIVYGGLINEHYVIKAQHGDGGPRNQKPMDNHLTETSLLFALDAATGRLNWVFAPEKSIRNNAIAVGNGQVYVIDREPAKIDTILKVTVRQRRGKQPLPEHPTGTLLALDAQTGTVRWRDEDNIFGTALAVSTDHDALVMSYGQIGFARPSEAGTAMRVYRASNGRRLWETPRSGRRPTIVGRTIFAFPFAWDLLTGRQRTVEKPLPDRTVGEPWRISGKGQGCGLVAGSAHLLLTRSATLGYYDLTYDRGWFENYGGLRAGCFINFLPACGLVLMPDDTLACRCSYQNQANIALIHRGYRPPEVEPAPGQSNFRYGRYAKEPVFTGTLRISMYHEVPEVVIRYTLDGSEPTTQSPVYDGPFEIGETTTIWAGAFLEGRRVALRDALVFTKADALPAVVNPRRKRN